SNGDVMSGTVAATPLGVLDRGPVIKTYADLTGYDPADAFTVTGDVLVWLMGCVGDTPIQSTSGTTTISVGTIEAAQVGLPATTVDNSQFAATDVWVDSSPTIDGEAAPGWKVVSQANLRLFRSVDDL